ncbi:MAG TPA: CarD family transcriptional regulator, partial [Bacteroidota bacterium]|nr:CarD family transcriptional regulator [Bacteroidota bacterium]
MLDQLKKHIDASEPFRALEKSFPSLTPDKPVTLRGIRGSLLAFLATRIFTRQHRQVLLIVPDADRAEQMRDDCASLLGEQSVKLYAMPSVHSGLQLDVSASIAQVESLRALSLGEIVLVIASAEALTEKIPPQKEFSQRTMILSSGKEYPFEQLLITLERLGFEKKDFVEEYGDVAVRGGILDIFPFVGDNPIRIEFWGDTIESIREFDVISQRSIRELQEASIVADLHNDTVAAADHLEYSASAKNESSLFDYVRPDAILILEEAVLCQKEIDELIEDGHAEIFDWHSIEQRIEKFSRFNHSIFFTHESVIDFDSTAQPATGGSVKHWIEHVRQLLQQNHSVFLVCDSNDEALRLQELVEEELTSPNTFLHESGEELSDTSTNTSASIQYHVIHEALHAGFIYHPAQIAVFTEHEIFGRLKRRGTGKRRKFKGFSQKEVQQLQRGDFVVHQDYGIGKFVGLQKISVRGVETEVMKLLYEGSDTLYVNLNFINRVQKYSSQEGHVPKLGKLGGPDWERLKNRARKKIKDIARDLIKLYARRKHEQGFAFAQDTHWQKEMEASFQYEDTPDQATSTLAVKKDMESSAPMDRLICGDVGFGKTEIAVRAAFKAVMNGTQVAVLVPTTILAQQHFNTFMDRIGRYS